MEEFNQDLFFRDLSFDGYASISTRAMLIGNKKSLFENYPKIETIHTKIIFI
jgi:hypothetical protein